MKVKKMSRPYVSCVVHDMSGYAHGEIPCEHALAKVLSEGSVGELCRRVVSEGSVGD